jgi:hypothetical protein
LGETNGSLALVKNIVALLALLDREMEGKPVGE